METCRRQGCNRPAKGDEFCGTLCAKIHHGVIEYDPNASKRRRTRNRAIRKIRATAENPHTVEATNTHANRPRHQGPTTRRKKRIS